MLAGVATSRFRVEAGLCVGTYLWKRPLVYNSTQLHSRCLQAWVSKATQPAQITSNLGHRHSHVQNNINRHGQCKENQQPSAGNWVGRLKTISRTATRPFCVGVHTQGRSLKGTSLYPFRIPEIRNQLRRSCCSCMDLLDFLESTCSVLTPIRPSSPDTGKNETNKSDISKRKVDALPWRPRGAGRGRHSRRGRCRCRGWAFWQH